MIKLDIKKYCQNCTYFEPETKAVTFPSGNSWETDTIISCAKKDKCSNITKYLAEATGMDRFIICARSSVIHGRVVHCY